MSHSPRPPVFITGSGLISCAGLSSEELWQNIIAGKSGLKNGLGLIESLTQKNRESSALEMCLFAAKQAMQQAGWQNLNPDDGLILATTTGQILAWDKALTTYLKKDSSKETFEKAFRHQALGSLVEDLEAHLGKTPHRLLISSACTAATQALAIASLWLNQGKVKRCLVGGMENLCDLTVEGFKSLQLLSTEVCKPFDKKRNGINLSEGAAFLCLETQNPRDKAHAQISGAGLSTDGFHMTSPHPEGKGSQVAMTLALKSAGLQIQDIDWIHAHGTGSLHNDLSEGAAIQAVFGSLKDQAPYVASTKAIHGHALGASGLIETIVVLETLKNQKVFRTLGLQNPDPQIALRHPEKNLNHPLRHVLKNTLGFGGANASLIISQVGLR